ncbi:MAG: hypothetical protein LH629_11380 [Ignavibacteria bacterium]|nr:hypothetical protein [Ignavibacteria bacterium]
MKNDNIIQEELKLIAPHLAAKKKVNPFLVPNNYFASAEKRILDKVFNAKEESNQYVPEGYFERLPQLVLSKIKKEERIENQIPVIAIQSRLNLKSILQFAAAIAAFVMLLYPVINSKKQSSNNSGVTIQQVSNEELNNYFDENVISINEDDVAAHVSAKKLDNVAKEISSQNNVDESSLDLSQIDLADIENL